MKPIRSLLFAALALASAPAAVHAQADTAASNWHLLDPTADRVPGISAERTYRELLAGRAPRDTVIVAIIDSGVEIDHPDLDGVIWTNRREVAGNNRDDDGNGYVDDIHGWDFIGGRDGRDVGFDTYEVTRLYGRLRPLCEAPATPAPAQCAQWNAVREGYTARRQEEMQGLQQMRMLEGALNALQQAMGGELTPAAVQAFQPATPQANQGKQIYLALLGMGYTPDDIREQRANMEGAVQYSLNPEFDTRDVVGDDPNNPRERGYGNNEVEGPDAGHGTHVAAIVAAERGNGVGIDGIAPAVRIMVIRAVPNGDERDKDIANGIRYAVDNGARVINMSFGKSFSPQKELVDEAVRYAESKGVLLVHAAGNDGADLNEEPSFPVALYQGGSARASNWIEVGASSWQGGDHLAASFSNYGRGHVDVFAPGVAIYSAETDATYGRNDGTSMAAPVVSGVAATLLAYFPELTPAQVREIIMQSATPFRDQQVVRPGSEDERVPFGQLSEAGGVVNLYSAFQMAQQRARR